MKPTRIYSFIGLIIAVMVFISFDISPSNFVNAEPVSVTITLSINNSCIVNNANVAIRNDNATPIDATNNWWGMPIGPTDFTAETFAGDSVKGAVSYIPFQTLIPDGCALSGTDWIPFTEQDVQSAIQTELPNLRGIGFALVDFQVEVGAKFTFVTTPAYGSLQSEATIRMVPSTDGNFVTWVLDTNLPTNATLRQIATCELMPLFINSLQQVKTRLTLPSQEMAQMVVMDDALRLRFSQPTEITLEPAPPLTMTYDTTCLPSPTAMQEEVVWGKPYAPQSEPVSQPAPTPMMISDMRSEPNSVLGQTEPAPEFLTVDTFADDISVGKQACTSALDDCSLRGAVEYTLGKYPQKFVIIVPNGTYTISDSLRLNGNIQLVGEEAYTSKLPNVIIQSATNNFHMIGIDSQGLPDIVNVAIYNITIQNSGGAFNTFKISNSKVNIYNSKFSNNSRTHAGGAIIWNDSVSFSPSNITIANTVFENNSGHMGGAIVAQTSIGSMLLECVTFDGNSANFRGGAIGTYDTYFRGEITIRESNFINNTSPNGGALYREDGAIEFEDTFWSPIHTDTPNKTNSVINQGTTGISLGTSVSTINDFDCTVPPPLQEPSPVSDVEVSLTYVQTETRNGVIKPNVNESNIIPYADYIRVHANITNNTDTTIQSGMIKFTSMEKDTYAPTRDDVNNDWYPWLHYSGGAYSEFEKRVLFTGLSIPPSQTVYVEFVVRMRRSGTEQMPFEQVPFTFEGCYGVFECEGTEAKIVIDDTLQFPISIAVTRLDFRDSNGNPGEHWALRSAMFWAIFNETSEDNYTSGSLYDIWLNHNLETNEFKTIYNLLGYPNGLPDILSENPPVVNANFPQYQVVNFLRQPPYCDPTVSPDLGNNDQPNEQSWFNNIEFVTHCNYTEAELGDMQNIFNGDHRYLMAQVTLSGMLYNERKINGAEGLGVFQYFTSNYKGSLGNRCERAGLCDKGDKEINDLWEATNTCISLPYDNYALALADGNASAALWLDAYLVCMLNRTDNFVRRFIFQQAYDNIMREVDKVLGNIQYDPMGGMYSVKDANLNSPENPDNVIKTIVGDETCNVTQAQTIDAYNAHIATATPNLRQYEGSDLPTILRPVLKIDMYQPINPINNQPEPYYLCGEYLWITKSFQGVTGDINGIPYYYHYPR